MPYLIDSRGRALGPPDGQLHARRRDVPRRLHLLALTADHGGDRRECSRGSTASRARSRTPTRSRPSAGRGGAIAAGRFAREIAPVTVTGREGTAVDRRPRRASAPGTTIESLRKLPPVFGDVEGQPGIITAGTSSGITDGGAALVLMQRGRRAARRGLTPLARIIGWATRRRRSAHHGDRAGAGDAQAARAHRADADDFDLVELNEAFAPQVLAVLRDEPIPREKLNVNGGAIALGHPIGCTGARIVVTLLHEMQRRGAGAGSATLCVSGGMGMAMAVETI